jgi:O-antigen/teichoic acid export membrane protein
MAGARAFCKNTASSNAFEAEMTPESLQNLMALALGFAVAGLCSSAYQLATDRLPTFNLLSTGPSPQAFAAVPLLMMAAPFLIMRNTILGRQQEGRRFEFVFLATVIAGFWSLMLGMVLVSTLQACTLLFA